MYVIQETAAGAGKDSPSVEALLKYEKDSFSGIEMKWLPRWKLQDEKAPLVEATR